MQGRAVVLIMVTKLREISKTCDDANMLQMLERKQVVYHLDCYKIYCLKTQRIKKKKQNTVKDNTWKEDTQLGSKGKVNGAS